MPAEELKTLIKNQTSLLKLAKAISSPLLFYKEGLNAIVSVNTNPKLNIIALKTDGQMEAAMPLNPGLPASTSDEKARFYLV